MKSALIRLVLTLPLAGCATPAAVTGPASPPAAAPRVPPPAVVQAQFAESPPATASSALDLAELIRLTVAGNPRLAQVAWAVEAARGQAVQVGLYPNPTLTANGDEIGDRQGPGGTWTAPLITQEVVTAGKLGLSRAAALRGVDQAALDLVAERYRLFTGVRQAYWEVVTLKRRAVILRELITLSEKSVENARTLLNAKLGSELDVVQLEVDRERYRAELDAATRSLPGARRRLAASVGVPDLPDADIAGDLDTPLPDYDLARVRAYVVGIHPDIRSAQIGVERARLLVRRAEVEPIPNVTVGAGYVRQNQNKSDDYTLSVSVPVPAFNRNQGNVFAAKARLGEAVNQVGVAQNTIVGQLAAAFATYEAAKARAGRYREAVVPKAEETYRLSLKAYQGGQFEYLRVLQAQRAVAEARLEVVRSRGEAWQAASTVAGLMLEDQWPRPIDAADPIR